MFRYQKTVSPYFSTELIKCKSRNILMDSSFVSKKCIVPYEQYKEKLGKRKQNPQFAFAMTEIEENPNVLLLGEDAEAVPFLQQFYEFTQDGVRSTLRELKRSKARTRSTTKPASPVHTSTSSSLSQTTSVPSIHNSPVTNDQYPISDDHNSPINTLSSLIDDDNISIDHDNNNNANKDPAATADSPISCEASEASTIVTLGVDQPSSTSCDLESKLARKAQRKAEKKAAKKEAKREAKRQARKAEKKLERRRLRLQQEQQEDGSTNGCHNSDDDDGLFPDSPPLVLPPCYSPQQLPITHRDDDELTGSLSSLEDDSAKPSPSHQPFDLDQEDFALKSSLRDNNLPTDPAQFNNDHDEVLVDQPDNNQLATTTSPNLESTSIQSSPLIVNTNASNDHVLLSSSPATIIDKADDNKISLAGKRPRSPSLSPAISPSSSSSSLSPPPQQSIAADDELNEPIVNSNNNKRVKRSIQDDDEHQSPPPLDNKTGSIRRPPEQHQEEVEEHSIAEDDNYEPINNKRAKLSSTHDRDRQVKEDDEQQSPLINKTGRNRRSKRRLRITDSSDSDDDEKGEKVQRRQKNDGGASVSPSPIDGDELAKIENDGDKKSPPFIVNPAKTSPSEFPERKSAVIPSPSSASNSPGLSSQPKQQKQVAATVVNRSRTQRPPDNDDVVEQVPSVDHRPTITDVIGQLRRLCRSIKASLVRGQEDHHLATSQLDQLTGLDNLRLPALVQAWDLMDCVKKCRRYKQSSEVRQAADRVLRHFQSIQSNATQQELTEAQSLVASHAAAQKRPPDSRPQPSSTTDRSTLASTDPQPPTVETPVPAPPSISADLDAKMDDILSRLKATEERLAAQTSSPATATSSSSHKMGRKASVRQEEEEDRDLASIMSRVDQVAAAASTVPSTTTTNSPPHPQSVDLDSHIDQVVNPLTSESTSSKLPPALLAKRQLIADRMAAAKRHKQSTAVNAISVGPTMDVTKPTSSNAVGKPQDDELYDLLGV